jgi:hypothetical protein
MLARVYVCTTFHMHRIAKAVDCNWRVSSSSSSSSSSTCCITCDTPYLCEKVLAKTQVRSAGKGLQDATHKADQIVAQRLEFIDDSRKEVGKVGNLCYLGSDLQYFDIFLEPDDLSWL